MFSLSNLDDYISKYNGNMSIAMDLLEHKIIEYNNDSRSGLHEGEYYMFYEFCFFEEDYYRIKKDILINNITEDIVDIGCQCGFQSEIFIDTNKYIGIDCLHNYFFNEEHPNTLYISDKFPTDKVDLTDKVVISNMSLGYFNNFLGEKNVSSKDLSEMDINLILELKKSKVLYCNSKPIFIEELKKHFKNFKFLSSTPKTKISSGVYKFWN